MTDTKKAIGAPVDLVLGPLPPQREGQYLTMTICGTSEDPSERGHWSSPAHVQWRIDKAVAAERERCAKLVENHVKPWPFDKAEGMIDQQHLRQWLAKEIRGPNVLLNGLPR